jgi:hypothetical protein
MEFWKALIPGTILTLVACGILGSNGSKGGFLLIFHQTFQGVSFYWSWPMFIAGTLLAWALFAMTPK